MEEVDLKGQTRIHHGLEEVDKKVLKYALGIYSMFLKKADLNVFKYIFGYMSWFWRRLT